ncbi:hypothetical protein BZG02_14205 [Labilibaculum filiforme]|uniref:Uncharacterized protein n=1 Tax=Labilibaculum filiforme TaxID=1940526 RepID=A0A2N3HVJ6_9BACT|nr:hypothetical protein BZG02_14205 [Labilibaculum filiforme]
MNVFREIKSSCLSCKAKIENNYELYLNKRSKPANNIFLQDYHYNLKFKERPQSTLKNRFILFWE